MTSSKSAVSAAMRRRKSFFGVEEDDDDEDDVELSLLSWSIALPVPCSMLLFSFAFGLASMILLSCSGMFCFMRLAASLAMVAVSSGILGFMRLAASSAMFSASGGIFGCMRLAASSAMFSELSGMASSIKRKGCPITICNHLTLATTLSFWYVQQVEKAAVCTIGPRTCRWTQLHSKLDVSHQSPHLVSCDWETTWVALNRTVLNLRQNLLVIRHRFEHHHFWIFFCLRLLQSQKDCLPLKIASPATSTVEAIIRLENTKKRIRELRCLQAEVLQSGVQLAVNLANLGVWSVGLRIQFWAAGPTQTDPQRPSCFAAMQPSDLTWKDLYCMYTYLYTYIHIYMYNPEW